MTSGQRGDNSSFVGVSPDDGSETETIPSISIYDQYRRTDSSDYCHTPPERLTSTTSNARPSYQSPTEDFVDDRTYSGIPIDRAINLGRSVEVVGTDGLGQRKSLIGIGWKEWLFVIVSTLGILATVSLTIYRLVNLTRDGNTSSPDFTFAVLILLNAVFCFVYVFNGVLREEKYQLCAYMAAILVIVLYCTIEYGVRVQHRKKIKLARLLVGWVMAPINVMLAVIVIKEFGRLAFRRGATDALQRVYKETMRFFSLLLFDLQIAGSVAVLVLKNGVELSVYEKVILAVTIPLSLLVVILGWLMVKGNQKRREKRKQTSSRSFKMGVAAFFFVAMWEPVYVIYKLVMLFIHEMDASDYLLYTQIFACFLALLVRLLVYFEFHRVIFSRPKANIVEPCERSGLLAKECE